MKFILKWLINGAISIPLLMYYGDISFSTAAITATMLTFVSYFVGDQFILRASNNAVATISDAVLAFVLLWIASYEMNWGLNFTEMLVITLLLGLAEWFLHRYLFASKLNMQPS